jgi:hypothetical protein
VNGCQKFSIENPRWRETPLRRPCSCPEAGCPDSVALRAILSGLETSTTPIPQAAIDNEDYGFHPEDDANDFVYGGSGKEVLFDLGGGDDSFFGYGGNDGGEYKSGYFRVIFGGSGGRRDVRRRRER